MNKKWEPRIPAIKRMLVQGMTNQDIGEVYGVSGDRIAQIMAMFGVKRLKQKKAAKPAPAEQAPVKLGNVTICPPRYAGGVSPAPSARPRGRR